jgi:hypothetical protein
MYRKQVLKLDGILLMAGFRELAIAAIIKSSHELFWQDLYFWL